MACRMPNCRLDLLGEHAAADQCRRDDDRRRCRSAWSGASPSLREEVHGSRRRRRPCPSRSSLSEMPPAAAHSASDRAEAQEAGAGVAQHGCGAAARSAPRRRAGGCRDVSPGSRPVGSPRPDRRGDEAGQRREEDREREQRERKRYARPAASSVMLFLSLTCSTRSLPNWTAGLVSMRLISLGFSATRAPVCEGPAGVGRFAGVPPGWPTPSGCPPSRHDARPGAALPLLALAVVVVVVAAARSGGVPRR